MSEEWSFEHLKALFEEQDPHAFGNLALALWLHAFGHPDDIEVTMGLLSKLGYRGQVKIQDLPRREWAGRRTLEALSRSGWVWKPDGPGDGHLELRSGGKGRPPKWLTVYIWMACEWIEDAVRDELKDPNPPYVKYRVRNNSKIRDTIRELLSVAIPEELLSETKLKNAVGSWLKRRGTGKAPPWEEPLAEDGS